MSDVFPEFDTSKLARPDAVQRPGTWVYDFDDEEKGRPVVKLYGRITAQRYSPSSGLVAVALEHMNREWILAASSETMSLIEHAVKLGHAVVVSAPAMMPNTLLTMGSPAKIKIADPREHAAWQASKDARQSKARPIHAGTDRLLRAVYTWCAMAAARERAMSLNEDDTDEHQCRKCEVWSAGLKWVAFEVAHRAPPSEAHIIAHPGSGVTRSQARRSRRLQRACVRLDLFPGRLLREARQGEHRGLAVVGSLAARERLQARALAAHVPGAGGEGGAVGRVGADDLLDHIPESDDLVREALPAALAIPFDDYRGQVGAKAEEWARRLLAKALTPPVHIDSSATADGPIANIEG